MPMGPGRFFVRENGHSQPLKLKQLYQLYKDKLIEENDFIQCLERSDNLIEDYAKKKQKHVNK